MGEDGLAAAMMQEENRMRQGLGQGPQDGQGPGRPANAPMVSAEELVAMMKQGITPEELAQQGVPVELIDQALMILQAEVQQGAPAQPTQGALEEQGLAGMYMNEEDM